MATPQNTIINSGTILNPQKQENNAPIPNNSVPTQSIGSSNTQDGSLMLNPQGHTLLPNIPKQIPSALANSHTLLNSNTLYQETERNIQYPPEKKFIPPPLDPAWIWDGRNLRQHGETGGNGGDTGGNGSGNTGNVYNGPPDITGKINTPPEMRKKEHSKGGCGCGGVQRESHQFVESRPYHRKDCCCSCCISKKIQIQDLHWDKNDTLIQTPCIKGLNQNVTKNDNPNIFKNIIPPTPKFQTNDALSSPPTNGLTYWGGPLLTNVQVITIFWGSKWNLPEASGGDSNLRDYVNNFFKYILKSEYIEALTEYSTDQYNIGPGSLLASFVDISDPPNNLTDDDVQQRIHLLYSNGKIPMPGGTGNSYDNNLYFIYLPSGTTVKDNTGTESCNDFCGYHYYDYDNNFQYAVIVYPDQNCGCLDGNKQDSLTLYSSHELCEAITDPQTPQNFWGYFDNDAGWRDFKDSDPNQVNTEIADYCAGHYIKRDRIGGFQVQKIWSIRRNECVSGIFPPGSQFFPAPVLQSPAIATVDIDGKLPFGSSTNLVIAFTSASTLNPIIILSTEGDAFNSQDIPFIDIYSWRYLTDNRVLQRSSAPPAISQGPHQQFFIAWKSVDSSSIHIMSSSDLVNFSNHITVPGISTL